MGRALIRCYVDRIHYPNSLKQFQETCKQKNALPNLECSSCQEIIGVPMTYEKENRLAFLLRPGSFKLKKIY